MEYLEPVKQDFVKSPIARKQAILWSILLIPYLEPNGINSINPILHNLYLYAQITIDVLLFFYMLSLLRAKKLSFVFPGSFVLLVLFTIYLLSVTLVYSGQFQVPTRFFIVFTGLSMYIIILTERPHVLIKAFLVNLEIIIYLNTISLLMFPNGLYQINITSQDGLRLTSVSPRWLLGYDNHWFIVYIATMFFSLVHYKYFGGRTRLVVILVTLHVTALLQMSGVLLVGTFGFDILILSKIYKNARFNYIVVWVLGILASIVVVFFYSSGLLQFILDILQRPMSTLLARVHIWDVTIDAIYENPIIGHGREPEIYRQLMYGMHSGVNAHNMWLEMLYECGLIGSGIFASLVASSGMHMRKSKRTEFISLLLSAIFVCLVVFSVDSALELRGSLFFALMIIASRVDLIQPKLDEIHIEDCEVLQSQIENANGVKSSFLVPYSIK